MLIGVIKAIIVKKISIDNKNLIEIMFINDESYCRK